MESVRVCHVCGNTHSSEATRCANCWAQLSDDDLVTQAGVEPPTLNRDRVQRRRRNVRWYIAGVIVLVLLIWRVTSWTLGYLGIALFASSPSSTISSLPGASDWPMFQRDPTHTAFVVDSPRVPEGNLKWRFQTDFHLYSSPAVAEGLVYLTTGDRRILALDAESGELIWEYRANDPVHSSPAVAGDLVFFGLQDGRVIALNRTGGQSEWEFMTEGPVVSSPVVRDGVLYIASGDERLYALDALTGRECWSYISNGWIGSSPAVFDGVIAVTSYDTKLHIIDIDIGRKRLDFFVSIRPQASPSFGGKYLFVSNASDRLNAIDWRKKHLPFEKAAMRLRVQLFNWGMVGSVPPEKGYVWSLLEDTGFISTPAVAWGRVYAATSGGKLIAVDEESGEKLWEFDSGSGFEASPSVVNQTLFIGDTDGRLHALDVESGQKLWEFQTGDRISATPVVAGGVLFLASWDGSLYAIE